MKKIIYPFIVLICFCFSSCTPGERNKESSSNENAATDSIEAQHAPVEPGTAPATH